MSATLREKLQAMADRGTPPEQEIARTKLAAMGPPPPRRPTAVGASPSPELSWGWSNTSTIYSAGSWSVSNINVTWSTGTNA